MHHIIKRIVAILRPSAVIVHFYQPLHANLTDTSGHAAGLHRLAATFGIFAFDARIAGDAFFRDPGVAAVHTFFIRAGLNAFAIAATLALVNQNDTVFRPFVNRFARAGGEASWIAAVIADAREIKKPGFMFR